MNNLHTVTHSTNCRDSDTGIEILSTIEIGGEFN